jgi:acyl-CoA synthetase (AMP-forming)/AMP-acid ligase II
MGPGARLELAEQEVRGIPQPVFARRLPHLRALLEQGASQYAESPYLVHPGGVVTFGEAAGLVANMAEHLHEEFGIAKGDRVALVAATCFEHVIAAWAVIVLGGVIVGLNGWSTGSEMEYGIEMTEPELLLGDSRRLARVEGRFPRLPRYNLEQINPDLDVRSSVMPSTPIDEDDPFVILFTSGTTGRPKGAVLSHRNNLHWIQSIALRVACAGQTPLRDSCEIAALPMFHISGLNAQAIMSAATGAKLVYTSAEQRWNPEEHLRLSEQHRVTTWRIVPTQGWKLAESPSSGDTDLSSLRNVTFGGSFVSPVLIEKMSNLWPHLQSGFVVGFGMTETNGTGASATTAELLSHPGCVGKPLPGSAVRVCEPGSSIQCVDGEVGEIQIRSASVFLGYYDDDAGTAAVLDDKGWYRTGDFGRVTDGLLVLEGRRSDLIVRNGENVYPREIEDRLLEHPGVAEAAVFGIPDRIKGEMVAAVVVRRPGNSVEEDELRGWVGERLAAFKVPEHLEFATELPRNALGKTVKHLLQITQPMIPTKSGHPETSV